MSDGDQEGMQDFDGNIEKLIRAGVIDLETGLAFATNPGNLRLSISPTLRTKLNATQQRRPMRKPHKAQPPRRNRP